MTIRKILVPVDFSPGSDTAASYALGLARQLGAEATFIHVYGIPVYPVGPEGSVIIPAPDVVAGVLADAEAQLRATCERIGAPEIAHRTVEGAPADTITRIAAEERFDLVVMGTHGRTGLRHALLGSVAERVVRTSRVPVLTVHLPRPGKSSSVLATPPVL